VSTPSGPMSRQICVVTPTSEKIVPLPLRMEGQDIITHGPVISDEVPYCHHSGLLKGMCPLLPSEPILCINSPEVEPKNTIAQSNSSKDNGSKLDTTSGPCSDFDQYQIPSYRVCLWMIHLHNKLEWIINRAKAAVHITQQTYYEMNRAMCRLFLYFLITHWVDEVIKWMVTWRLVYLPSHNNPQHGVGLYFVTLKILRGSVPSITWRNCLLSRYCEPSTAPSTVSSQNGVGHRVLTWFFGDHCLKPVSPGFEIS
jgi:hypothetical protein